MITRSSYLAARPETVFEHVRTSKLLHFVASPLIYFKAIDPPALPEVWRAGEYRVRMLLFGVLPLGWQVIGIAFPPPENGNLFVRDNGRGQLIKVWDHLITITPEGAGTRYEDQLKVEAGLLTFFIAGFAWIFYGHRQRRWRRLVRQNFDYGVS